MYNEPDNVSRLTTPLKAATPNNCRALVRNPAVTGSSELRSNLRFICVPRTTLQRADYELTGFCVDIATLSSCEKAMITFDLNAETPAMPKGIYDLVNNATSRPQITPQDRLNKFA